MCSAVSDVFACEGSERDSGGQREVLDERIERRRALKTIAIIAAAGTGAALLGAAGLFELFAGDGVKSSLTGTPNSSYATVNQTGQNTSVQSNVSRTFQTIKVVYFGMAIQSTGTRQEYVSLPTPAYFQDLLSEIRDRHVVLGPMLSTMQVVINGNPVEGNPILNNNDEVDFIPVFAGG